MSSELRRTGAAQVYIDFFLPALVVQSSPQLYMSVSLCKCFGAQVVRETIDGGCPQKEEFEIVRCTGCVSYPAFPDLLGRDNTCSRCGRGTHVVRVKC